MNNEIKNVIESLLGSRSIEQTSIKDTIIIYRFQNKYDLNIEGSIAVSPEFDVLYLEVMGMTNRRFGRGESLVGQDVERFINNAINEKVTIETTIFGRKKIKFDSILLNQKLAASET